jgi:hypothetical protein
MKTKLQNLTHTTSTRELPFVHWQWNSRLALRQDVVFALRTVCMALFSDLENALPKPFVR